MLPRAEAATVARPDGARTAAEVRRALTAKFQAAGLDSPDLDSRILVGHALGLDHAALAAAATRKLGADEENVIATLANRRLTGEPVARILGYKEFWSLPLRVDAATLVPRPETETVVEAALAAIDTGGPRSRKLRIADLGTGSGALILALLSELPNAFGVGYRYEYEGACGGARQCPSSRPDTGKIRRLRHGGGVAWPVRCDRVQSALHRLWRHRHARVRRARFRSPSRARWRNRWARLLSRHRRGGPHPARARRGLGRRAWHRPGGTGRPFICSGGACAVTAAPRP